MRPSMRACRGCCKRSPIRRSPAGSTGAASPSPIGALSLALETGASLSARCAPCMVRVAAFGDVPLRLDARRSRSGVPAKARYEGRSPAAASCCRSLPTATARSMTLRAELPPTPIATLAALFSEAVPEARIARIDGTLAARVSFVAPAQRWRLESIAVDGFSVHGLGTEALAHASAPAVLHRIAAARLSPWLERAVIAAEDQRFAEHPGYDLTELRLLRRRSRRARRRARGASTITQQLARADLHRRRAQRVAQAARAAVRRRDGAHAGQGPHPAALPRVAPWGDGICGAEAAARRHFGKSAAQLQAHEAAWLAVRLRARTGRPMQ